MPDLLESSSAWLQSQRHRHLSRPVLYVRGAERVEVAATVGQTVFRLDDGAGGILHSESRDYLIRAADLMLAGERVTPRRGDQVRETDAGVTFVYEVTAPGDEPHWRYSDPYRLTLRIHTQQIDQENTDV
jgi:hypothetical protein